MTPREHAQDKQVHEDEFIRGFEYLQHDAASINRKNGFVAEEELIDDLEKFLYSQVRSEVYEKFKPLFPMFRNSRVGLKLMLAVSELGEALEAVRKNLGPDDHIPEHSAEAAEVADAIIRLMNYATDRKLDLANAIVDKNNYNRNRHDHSKEGRAAVNGKRF